jgi:hypothetical protein
MQAKENNRSLKVRECALYTPPKDEVEDRELSR